MTNYRIDPPGVSEVLTAVQRAADDLSSVMRGVSGAPDDVSTGSGSCTAVPNALAEFMDAQTEAVTDVSNRISACLFGAATATADYVHADDVMASDVREAQSEAESAASSGDFSWFTARASGR